MRYSFIDQSIQQAVGRITAYADDIGEKLVWDNITAKNCLTGSVPQTVETEFRECLNVFSDWFRLTNNIDAWRQAGLTSPLNMQQAKAATIFAKSLEDWPLVQPIWEEFWYTSDFKVTIQQTEFVNSKINFMLRIIYSPKR